MKLLKEYVKSLLQENAFQPNEVAGMKLYLNDLADAGVFSNFQDEEELEEFRQMLDRWPDERIAKATGRYYGRSAEEFVEDGKAGGHDYIEPVLDEDPDEEGEVSDEISSVGGGAISGYSLPLGMTPKNRRAKMEKPWKSAARAFGGGKKSKKKNPYGLK